MLKVLMLAGRYGLRGATTVIENLASNLINCGIDVTIGALQFLRAPLIKGIETQKISLNPIQASRQLKKYDIINNHHGLVNLISLLSKKPFIFQGHGAPNYGYSRIYKPNLLNPAYLVQNRITNFIAISDAKNRELKEKFSEDKVFLLKNGVDINRYRPNLEKRFRKGDPQLLFVGNLHPHKNVEEIIRSIPTLIPEYPNVNFQIIGDGKEFDMLENLIKEIDVQKNVELLGRISLEDLPFYYNSCDVYVSASRFEVCPVPPIEAMTCGKPVLLSNIGPHNETVQNSNADLVYHSGDLQDFGRKMRILYQEKDTFESISINYSKDHSWQKKAEILSKLYYDILNM